MCVKKGYLIKIEEFHGLMQYATNLNVEFMCILSGKQ